MGVEVATHTLAAQRAGIRWQRWHNLAPKSATTKHSCRIGFSSQSLAAADISPTTMWDCWLLSYFSEMTIRMNVKMEHFTPGGSSVLKRGNLAPAASSDVVWSVSGYLGAFKAKRRCWNKVKMCVCVCVFVCSQTCYTVRTNSPISLAKRGQFAEWLALLLQPAHSYWQLAGGILSPSKASQR